MKKMTLVTIVVVVLVAVVFVGCKYIRGQILDGPGMERDSADYSVEEPVDGLNKEAILDGPDGTSTHAYTGSKDSVEVDLLDIEEMPKTAVPSTEGVVSLDWEKKEIIAASYGYDDDGRYSVNKAYSLDGKFLRRVGDKERE